MNLYDENRPKLPNGRRCWQRNHIYIPDLNIFPLESGDVEISIFLPLKEENFISKRFSIILDPQYLPSFLKNFTNDPEEICEFYFKHPDPQLMPELRIGGRLSAEYSDQNINTKIKAKITFEKIATEELEIF